MSRVLEHPCFDVTAHPHELVTCALCGSREGATVATQDRYGLPVRFLECAGCGLRYLNPRMTAEGYAAFYQDGYRPLLTQWMGYPHDPATLEPEQWRYAVQVANLVATVGLTGGTLLDVGGSSGIVGRLFRARWGYAVTVVDPAPDELALARDCQTVCGSAEDVELPSVDLALLCRTIEHLRDPIAVLGRLRTVATALIVDARDTDNWPEGFQYQVDHPYAFTRTTLERALRATGWRPRHGWTTGKDRRYVGFYCDHQE